MICPVILSNLERCKNSKKIPTSPRLILLCSMFDKIAREIHVLRGFERVRVFKTVMDRVSKKNFWMFEFLRIKECSWEKRTWDSRVGSFEIRSSSFLYDFSFFYKIQQFLICGRFWLYTFSAVFLKAQFELGKWRMLKLQGGGWIIISTVNLKKLRVLETISLN